MNIRKDADYIVKQSLIAAMPDEAVAKALKNKSFSKGRVLLVSVGKAAWQMAKMANNILGDRIDSGVVITKYGHVNGKIANYTCFEAGHPIPDINSFIGTEKVLTMVSSLTKDDTVLFLLSGGGSALFEKPLISPEELADITTQLLDCGADIVEINTIRKRISAVKGGKFAVLCQPAQLFGIVLSDIIGDPLDMIASGPAYPDSSSSQDALNIIAKYKLKLSSEALKFINTETPKTLNNIDIVVTGSVKQLCEAAAKAANELNYETIFLTDCLDCEAREAGSFFGSIAKSAQKSQKSIAYIAGGETVVHITGKGKGGRNQEIVLSAAEYIKNCLHTAILSIGSDGTDGPTDAAGGYADEHTYDILSDKGISIYATLKNNDAYYALQKSNGLIITGPTGTNVNDITVLLIKR